MSSRETEFPSFNRLVPEFLVYAQVELRYSPQSLVKYRDCLRQVVKVLGDKSITDYDKNDILALKSSMLSRNLSVSRQVSILAATKRFFQFCREQRALPALYPETILIPKQPRREVTYLTPQEVERFVDTIPLTTGAGTVYMAGLRFRALVETLLGTAMRIGEVLSLDRNRIDYVNGEAKIIGKGNKERVAFFTDRALHWVKRYLECREGNNPAVFVSLDGATRLKRTDIWRPFVRHREWAGINKRITPHLLRHTAATQLLFNGCPIGHIKEILGHERLETTCRYYLGLDHRAAKQAHRQYLTYEPGFPI